MYFSRLLYFCLVSLFSVSFVFGFPVISSAEQRIIDTCITGESQFIGFDLNSFLIYQSDVSAEIRINFTPKKRFLDRYYDEEDIRRHQQAIAEFVEMRDGRSEDTKLLNAHIFPRPYFNESRGYKDCTKGPSARMLHVTDEFPYYEYSYTPRISGSLCVSEPKIVGHFRRLLKTQPNSLDQLLSYTRWGYFSVEEILYSPLYKGAVMSPLYFQSKLKQSPILDRLGSDFQDFVQDLTYLTLVQCGELPKKVRLEVRAFNPDKDRHVDQPVFSDGTIEAMTGTLNFSDEGITLNEVVFSEYGQDLIEYSEKSVERLLKFEQINRLNQARWAARPKSALETFWRQAAKDSENLTMSQIFSGLVNSVENHICNQPITKENLGDKYAAGCDDVRFGIIPKSARD